MPPTKQDDELRRIQRELDDLRQETRQNSTFLAGAVRRSRLNLAIAEHNESLRKLRQPTSLLDWHPRPGQPTDPNVQNSLLDRLRQGSPVADSLGNVDPIIASVNMLDDPLFEYYRRTTAFTVTTSEQTVSFDPGGATLTTASWFGSKTAGTVATVTTIRAVDRFGSGTNPFNSNGPSVTLAVAGAGTHEFILRSSGSAVFSAIPVTGYLVAAIKIARLTAPTLTAVTSRTAILELWDQTDGAVVASASLDLTVLSDTVPDAIRIVTGIRWTDLTAAQKTHSFGMRIRIQVVSSAGGATVVYHMGEPQLHGSSSPDAVVFAPMLPSFAPGHMMGPTTSSLPMAIRVADDSQWRIMFNADGSMLLGSGSAAVDLKLSRPSASVLRIDNAAAGRASVEAYAGTGPGTPGAGLGRLYYSSATKTWHGVDDAGLDTDLAASGGAAATQVSRSAVSLAADYVARIKIAADTTFRAFLGLTATDEGSLEFGPGGVAARNLRLYHNAGQLTLDTNGAAAGTRLAMWSTAGQTNAITLAVTADANVRTVVWGDATTTGLEFGPGSSARDLRALRSAAGQLKIDSNSAAATTSVIVEATAAQLVGLHLQVAGDANSRTTLRGDATEASIAFGGAVAARDLRAYRSAAKILTIDDNAAGAATLNVVGTLQQGGVAVALVTSATAGPDANNTVDAAGAAGTASTFARSQHGHQVATSATLPVALGAAAAGATGAIARSTHVHPTTGLSLSPHGAADHTDITRSLFLPANLAKLDVATAVNLGASPNLTPAVAYADAATQGAFWDFQVPADWASGVITIQPVWSPGASDGVAHTVRWSMTVKNIAAGTTVTAAGTTTAFTGASAVRTVAVVVFDTATSTGVTPAAANNLMSIELQRIGADALDSYIGVVNLLGIIVTYTANQ